jgi:hypothetical protein
MAKTRSSISGNIHVLPEQIPLASIVGGTGEVLNNNLIRYCRPGTFL